MRPVWSIAASLVLANGALAADRYLPDGSLSDDPDIHEWLHKRYVAVFKAFDEPSLLKTVEKREAKNKRIYRFTWLRSFDRPVCITLVAGDETKLTLKELDRKGDNKLGKLATKSIPIGRADYQRFSNLLDDADYRQMEPVVTDKGVGAWRLSDGDHTWLRLAESHHDGATWLLEYCHDDEYFFVERWCPARSRFGKACLNLIKLSGLSVDPERIY
jgi:hypothetical protein